jgi:hypothetical protein
MHTTHLPGFDVRYFFVPDRELFVYWVNALHGQKRLVARGILDPDHPQAEFEDSWGKLISKETISGRLTLHTDERNVVYQLLIEQNDFVAEEGGKLFSW